jgi:antitoxin YobK
MGMNEFRKAMIIVEKNDRADFDGPKDEKVINKAEKFLGLTFPTTYREFLKNLGCGGIGGMEFYGVIDENFENSGIPDAIWLTNDERQRSKLDSNLILIGQSIEGYYALDTTRMKDGECPVIDALPVGKRENFEVIAPDYGTFFLNEINRAI